MPVTAPSPTSSPLTSSVSPTARLPAQRRGASVSGASSGRAAPPVPADELSRLSVRRRPQSRRRERARLALPRLYAWRASPVVRIAHQRTRTSTVATCPSNARDGWVSTKRKIPAQRYDFPDEDVRLVVEGLERLLTSRSFLTLGEHVEQFEAAFGDLAGTSHAVAVSSGTAALEAVLRSIDVAGSEVVVPTNTFAATAFAVIHAGGRPVFADCGGDMNVDPVDVERRITDETKAVITVHIGGLISPGVVDLQDLCRSRGLSLIEDAAHAHGSTLDGRHAGGFGDAAAFSFFSTKVMTTGEGGMVVTDRDDIAEDVRIMRDQGKVAGRNFHELVGHNWRMTEFQALIGLAQLARLQDFVDERRRIARVYDDVLTEADTDLRPLAVPDGCDSNYYKYIVFVDGQAADAMSRRLREDFGVRVGGFVYDVPCHEQPVFEVYRRESLPRAEALCRQHVCPPIYPSLSDEDAQYVARALLEAAS
jgi:perosamine synthetase